MDKQLIAIRDGEYDEAIRLATAGLNECPDDSGSLFTLAQAYEGKQDYENAFIYAKKCADAEPEPKIFESLTIVARCAARLEKFDIAYQYAKQALLDDRDPNLPKWLQILYAVLSVFPGLKGLKYANKMVYHAYASQAQWLRDYVDWYEKNIS